MTDSSGESAQPLFPLGRVVMTTNLQAKLQEAIPTPWDADLIGLIARYSNGDWGGLDEKDKRQNDLALDRGFRIFSAHETGTDVKIWIITEADQSVSLLLPEDY